jgi:hypothetical protein
MNVQELIKRLQQLPQDAPVAIGTNELLVVQTQRVLLNGETEPREVVQLDWFPF